MNMKEFWKILYPPRCMFCYELLEADEIDICQDCLKKLPLINGQICLTCGKPLEDERAGFCPDCQKHQHLFEYGRAFLSYTKTVQAAIIRYKYKNQRGYGKWFGRQMAKIFAKEIRRMRAQVLVPVPLYIRKEKIRGFNQAELLAQVIGNECGMPVQNLLRRCRNTGAQKELGYESRLANLEGGFQLSDSVKCVPEAVILVDDIYTTGSTIDSCAAVLKKEGVKRVYFLAIAIGMC